MSRSGHLAVVGTFAMPPGTVFAQHAHDQHQLAWAAHGVLVVDTDVGSWVLPPSRALWIPSGCPHTARSSGKALMRSLYFTDAGCPIRWTQPTPVEVGPLLTELIDRLDDPALPDAPRLRTEAVLFDLLVPVTVAMVQAPLPDDPRARDVARRLLADPGDRRTIDQWGTVVGASSRTLARAFLAGTGVSFGRWRTSARMLAALPLLAGGETLSRVANLVGYETTSSFVAAFRRETGVTPGSYFADAVSPSRSPQPRAAVRAADPGSAPA